MALSDIDINSAALIGIDANPINSFDDQSREAQVAAILYPPARLSLLTSFRWNFNTIVASLNQEFGDPANKQWTYKFLEPSGMINLIDVLDQNSESINYDRYQGRIFTNYQVCQARYQRDIDETDFPAYFTDALIARLKWEYAEPLNGEGASKDRLDREYKEKLRLAKLIDSQSKPPLPAIDESSPWLAAHYSRQH